MIVVADSSPLVALTNIGPIDILPSLFGQIPPQILAELRAPRRPQSVRDLLASSPPWLRERSPRLVQSIQGLHGGEIAAISLAEELDADLLLIDEKLGRQVAARRKIRFAGTVGVLELAADRGRLDLQDAFARLKNTDFWISLALLDRRLELYISRKRPV
jgi:predicted nucleic acid-binding protein